MPPGRPRTQKRTIEGIDRIAQSHGFKVQLRKGDPGHERTIKKFLPDVIAIPLKGKQHRIFEVEKTVNNNTVFKSIASLAGYLVEHDGSNGYIVVPAGHKAFVDECVKHFRKILVFYGKRGRGKRRKPRIEPVTFEQVKLDEEKVKRWEKHDRRGQPPKCKYLPRPC